MRRLLFLSFPTCKRCDLVNSFAAGEQKHEQYLNFVDRSSSSKVLVSSRIRTTLSGDGETESTDRVSIVDIKVPTEEQATNMLLSIAGINLGELPPPKEAFELVKLCQMLPLTISIAAQLVRDLELDATSDWDGIISLMQEEFESENRRSVEQSVIVASLNSIGGIHKDNVRKLFQCMALVPEDTVVPLEVLALIFQAASSSDETLVPRPRIMTLRRWLKLLLDRSLLLGTVDRISLQ